MSDDDQIELNLDAEGPAAPVKRKGKGKTAAPATPPTAAEVEDEDEDEDGGEGNETPASPAAEESTFLFLKSSGPLHRLMDDNFMRYASYVIRDRAIPALADGLKPVQRRILHALSEMDDGRFIKVANVVGHTMQYHPHGDASIEDALVTLTNKDYLIEGQGNFGNLLTGDRAAASRYIECRLTELARNEIFNKDITEFASSYDGRRKEPITLPVKLPMLLMLGAEGIAVGLSTRILPHSFTELIEAQIAILQKKPFAVLPDFPQGGLLDASGLVKGIGTARVRARISPKGKDALCIHELPFGVTTEALTSSIEDGVRKGKVPVKSITDYTSEKVEIVLDLKPGTDQKKAIEALYAFTQCEVSVTSRIVAIDGRRPVELNVDEVLRANTAQLLITLERELEHRRKTLRDDLHQKTLVQIFVEHRIYKQIEQCKSFEAIVAALHKGFEPFLKALERALSDEDIEMLLGVRIRRISLFDINRHQKEIGDIRDTLAEVEKNLSNVKAYAIRYLKALIKKYGDAYPRRTQLKTFQEIEIRALTAADLKIGHDRESGYLGSKVDGEPLMNASPYDKLMLVWKDGRFKVISPPEKLFVDTTLLYCAKADRDKPFTMVYTQDGITYLKRFTFGGFIMNRDYQCAAEGANVLLFEEGAPERIYVKYRKFKNQRITQQSFETTSIAVKSAKARGNQMTVKGIAAIASSKPRWWDDSEVAPKGVML